MGFLERFLRPGRKFTDIIPIAALETFILIFIGSLIGLGITRLMFGPGVSIAYDQLEQLSRGLTPSQASSGLPDHIACASQYLSFLGIWIVIPLAMLLPPSNRPMLKKFLFEREGNTFTRMLFGLLAGFLINSICVGISLFLGDIALSFNHFEPIPLLILLASVLVQSGAEEIACRQFLYQKLTRRYRSPIVAAIFSTVFFAACHLGNPGIGPVGIAQLFVVGVLFCLLIYYYDALGACIAFHTAWNFTQNIVYGLPNSGLVSLYSIFKLEAASNGPFFDSAFGVEGGVGGVTLLALACVALIVNAKRKGLRPKDLWGDDGTNEAPEQQLPPAPKGPRHMA